MDRERQMQPVQQMSTSEIAVSMVKDTQLLLERQVERVRLELQERGALAQKAVMLAAAGAIFAAGTLVSIIFMVTRLLERYAALAAWVGFAISAGTLLVLTVAALLMARHLVREAMPSEPAATPEPSEREGDRPMPALDTPSRA